jgi:hypothetical protein
MMIKIKRKIPPYPTEKLKEENLNSIEIEIKANILFAVSFHTAKENRLNSNGHHTRRANYHIFPL